MLSILLALGSALAEAVYLVTQHVASSGAPRRVKSWRLAVYLVTDRLWLFGVAAMVTGFVLLALALYTGRISVVQSVLVSELVFSLVVGCLWLRRPVPGAAWAWASLTTVSLAVFLVMSEPRGGHAGATPSAWLPALLTCGALAAASALAARHAEPTRRAACYAMASGITGAVGATFLKSATAVLGHQGVTEMVLHGAVYGVVVVGVANVLLTQAALHRGPLAVSQPVMLIVNPVVGIALGVWLFGEHFQDGWWRIALGCLAFAAMATGVVRLARTAPSLAATPQPQLQP